VYADMSSSCWLGRALIMFSDARVGANFMAALPCMLGFRSECALTCLEFYEL
jgi:hypothetical protein